MLVLLIKYLVSILLCLNVLIFETCVSESEIEDSNIHISNRHNLIDPVYKIENFGCGTVANFTVWYLKCDFILSFYKFELDARCILNEKTNFIGVTIKRNPWILNATLTKLSRSLSCVSNTPMSVSVDFKDGVELPSFTNIRQEKLFRNYNDKTTYEYKLSIVLPTVQKKFKNDKVIKYKITSTYSVLEANILLVFQEALHNTQNGYQLFPKFFQFDITIQEFLQIPIVNLDNENYTLHRAICREKTRGECKQIKEDPELLCLKFSGNVLKDTTRKYYNLTEIFDSLNFTHDQLKVLEDGEFPHGSYDSANIESFSRPMFINNQVVNKNKFVRFRRALTSPSDVSCSTIKSLSYDQLKYMLHLLGVSERVLGGKKPILLFSLSGFRVHYTIIEMYGPGTYFVGKNTMILNASDHFWFTELWICFKENTAFPIATYQHFNFPRYGILKNAIEDSLNLNCSSSEIFRMNSSPESNLKYTFDLSRHTFHEYRKSAIIVNSSRFMNEVVCQFEDESIFLWQINRNEHWKLSYSEEQNLFICEGNLWSKLFLRQWICNNHFQCLIVAARCLHKYANSEKENRRRDDSKFESSTWEKECMASIIEVQGSIGICSEDSEDINCVSVHPAEKGVVHCSGYSFGDDKYAGYNFERYYLYFRGFDEVLYYEKEMKSSPPLSAILKLSSLNSSKDFYVKGKYSFKCEAHSFFFDDGLQWFFQFENGSEFHATSLLPVMNFDFDDQKSTNSMVVMTILIKDKSLKEIICSAPVLGKETWENVTFQLNILEPTPPKIHSLEDEVQLVEGEKNQIIPCHANGIPRPTVTWTASNSKIEPPLQVLEDNTLLFPMYNSTFSAEYKCTASNIAGSVTKRIKVFGKRENFYTFTIVAILICVVTFILLLFLYYFVNKKMTKYREMKDVVKMLNGNKHTKTADSDQSSVDPMQLPFDETYEISKHSFMIDRNKLLGKGEFGEVYRGLLDTVDKAVAFKTVRSNSGTTPLKALVSELKIMMYIGSHENLVTLLGAYKAEIRHGILYVAIEFCELGSLESFLRKHKSSFAECPVLSPKTENSSQSCIVANDQTQSLYSFHSLLKWSQQISSAMEYLELKKVVHSDLATRNVLLTAQGDAKVTDFGLSRRTYNYTEYIKTAKDPLPWRWLALESLKTNTFSSQSDVWSYGITLWEMFSLGDVPYPGLSPTAQFVQDLENGFINLKPKYASDEIYDLMVRCWHVNPDQRPTFTSLKIVLGYSISKGTTNIYISPESNFENTLLLASINDYMEI